jgi:S-adenosylmethionine synthetase
MTEDQIENIPAKNQVTVFGYACDHTPELMPLPIVLAHKLARQLTVARKEKQLPYLMPDGKVQIGIEFNDRSPQRIHSITVTASQRNPDTPTLVKLRDDIIQSVIERVFENESLKPDNETKMFINPDGVFLGGPIHHSGLTGRKNAIDTYGEYIRHSGKALSGKDPLRIDRIGAYAARYAAKNIVAAKLARECEIMLSYTIGTTRPVSLQANTFGTGTIPDHEMKGLVEKHFEFRLAGILKAFELRYLPMKHSGKFYQSLAAYGHFGRPDLALPWEKTDRAEQLIS